MPKLTDTQLIVLSQSAKREDRAAELPARVNKTAAAKLAASLVARKLMREQRAKPGMPVWRTGDDGRRIGLVLTQAGLKAIGGAKDAAPRPSVPSTSGSRADEAMKAEGPSNAGSPRPGTKQALVVAMLAKDTGATLAALVEATGWLPHTTRAAITGLRKRGFAITRSRDNKEGSLYRIAGEPIASVRV